MTCISQKELNLWNKIIPGCKVIFDVGCRDDNIFYEINPKAEIHLFDPITYSSLLEKIKGKKNITFNNFALGNENSKKRFYYRYSSFVKKKKIIKNKKGFGARKNIQIKKLIDYVRKKYISYIDFLKIDAEGFELEVIKGCDIFIDNIKYIQIENFGLFYKRHTIQDIFNYFEYWNIYLIGGKPKNYLITKEKNDYLEQIIT